MSQNYQETIPNMSLPTCSRRAFLRATLLGATVPLAGRGLAAATPIVAANTHLYFFEINAVGGESTLAMSAMKLAFEPLNLDDPAGWRALLETLATTSRGLVVVGRSATVFAVRSVLTPGWRIALEGRHTRDRQGGRQHTFIGFETPLSNIAEALPRVTNFGQYAALLSFLPSRSVNGPADTALTRQSPAWPGADCVSLLAWSPRGVV